MELVIGLLLIIGITVFYSFSLSTNSKTPRPQGCEMLLENCGSCSEISCGHHGQQNKGDLNE